MKDRTPSKVESALERLNQDPYLLAAVTAVPIVGGSITQVLTGIGQQIVQERNARLLQQLSEHLADVDERSIKRDYFETPEGFDLLIKALDESRRTRSDEKRDLIARILRGAAIDDEGEYSAEEYLYLISDLTVQELRVAHIFYRDRPNFKEEDTWKAWEDGACAEVGIGKEDLHVVLGRLASTGLLSLVTAFAEEDGDTVVNLSPDAHLGEDSRYIVTSSFARLMEFLSLHA